MFKVAFRVVYRIKGRCSRHPSYNPVKDQQGGIKGGCKECHALLIAYRAYLAFREAIKERPRFNPLSPITSPEITAHMAIAHLHRNRLRLLRGGSLPKMEFISSGGAF